MSEPKPADERLDRRLDRLEEIVDALDRPDLELEDAMRLFEEGVSHLRVARELLRTTELRVERLLDDGSGGALTESVDERS
ncbi:MAG TPA: exodeoxyribonuclease VII small subunit [Longimicrobiales bacterium]|nr:exodeoxyribonuclease VII small subunit [Longimicrobiales bacterium]